MELTPLTNQDFIGLLQALMSFGILIVAATALKQMRAASTQRDKQLDEQHTMTTELIEASRAQREEAKVQRDTQMAEAARQREEAATQREALSELIRRTALQ